jgi:hypothetical protein
VQLLRNDVYFQFTDITLDAFGTYEAGFDAGGARMGPGHYRLMDVNGDGTLDIVGQLGTVPIDAMLTRIAYLNDGQGRFTPWMPRGSSGAMTVAEFVAGAKCQSCEYLPLVFDTNGSGIASLVLLDTMSSVNTTTPTIANPMQSTRVYLTTFAPTNLSASGTQSDCLFRWAESNYTTLFSPSGGNSVSMSPFRYRYYPDSNAYLGVSDADNKLYYVGPLSGNRLLGLGPVAPWLSRTSCR